MLTSNQINKPLSLSQINKPDSSLISSLKKKDGLIPCLNLFNQQYENPNVCYFSSIKPIQCLIKFVGNNNVILKVESKIKSITSEAARIVKNIDKISIFKKSKALKQKIMTLKFHKNELIKNKYLFILSLAYIQGGERLYEETLTQFEKSPIDFPIAQITSYIDTMGIRNQLIDICQHKNKIILWNPIYTNTAQTLRNDIIVKFEKSILIFDEHIHNFENQLSSLSKNNLETIQEQNESIES